MTCARFPFDRAGLCLGLVLCAGAASAAPGTLTCPLAEPGVALRDRAPSARMYASLRPGPKTVQLPPPAIAAAGGAIATAPPRFMRDDPLRESWRLALETPLLRAAVAGNVIFVFFDLADPTSIADHRIVALYQTNTPRTDRLAAALTLPLSDGFDPGHTYRLRIAQLFFGREVVLAEVDFTLE